MEQESVRHRQSMHGYAVSLQTNSTRKNFLTITDTRPFFFTKPAFWSRDKSISARFSLSYPATSHSFHRGTKCFGGRSFCSEITAQTPVALSFLTSPCPFVPARSSVVRKSHQPFNLLSFANSRHPRIIGESEQQSNQTREHCIIHGGPPIGALFLLGRSRYVIAPRSSACSRVIPCRLLLSHPSPKPQEKGVGERKRQRASVRKKQKNTGPHLPPTFSPTLRLNRQ
jgi:hypothetical protein